MYPEFVRFFRGAVFSAVVFLTVPGALAQGPQVLGYQGRVSVGGVNFEGNGGFKFALVNTSGSITYWSNDGTSVAGVEPAAAVSLPVVKGLYSVQLGDTTLTNMAALPAGVFNNLDVRLRIWFNDGVKGSQMLAPDQRLSPVAYAMVAQSVAPGAIGSAQLASGLTLGGTITLSGGINLPTTTASEGIILQSGSPLLHTFGAANFFAGRNAGNFTMTGGANVGIGGLALSANTTGTTNTALGASALNFNTAGAGNTASGAFALQKNTIGNNNTATGTSALNANTIGAFNSAYGAGALVGNTTAGRNVAIGANALMTQSFSNGGVAWNSHNTAVGFQALMANQPTVTTNGIANTALGAFALQQNTVGNDNTATGFNALFANTTGFYNTATGSNALSSNTAGRGNTAIGISTLQDNTTGDYNLASGLYALLSNTIGSNNTATGAYALLGNTTGSNNTACGYDALYMNTTGSANVASGLTALFFNTTGNNNTAVGQEALVSNTTGNNNIAVGFQAGNLLTTGSNNIMIGSIGTAADANTIRIGAGSQTKTFIAGIRGVTTGQNNGVTVLIDSNGQLGTVSSSRRYKEDIADMGDASARLQALRPVTFRYKKPYEDGEKPIQFGLIAEEVAAVFPELAVFNDDGQPETVKYQDLAPLLLNEYLKEHRQVEEQRASIEKQRQQIETLGARLQELEERLRKPAPAALRKSSRGSRP